MTEHPRALQGAAAVALRATTALPPHAHAKSEISLTLADVVAMIEDGRISYSEANRPKVLGAIRRCPELYKTQQLDQIPADRTQFHKKWGKGPVKSYPVGKFHDAKAFRVWRSNVSGALKHAVALTTHTAEATLPEVAAAWDGYLAEITAATGTKKNGAIFDPQCFNSYKRVAEIGRAAGVAPVDMTVEIFTAARDAGYTRRDREGVVRAAARHHHLRTLPAFAHLAPVAPTAPLPPLRRNRTDSVAALRPSVRDEWETWLAARPLERAPLTGEVIPLSEGLMGQYRAAFTWYVDGIAELNLVDLGAIESLQDLCRKEWVKKVVEAGVQRSGPGPNQATMGKYSRKLALLFEDYEVYLPKDKNLKQPTEMAQPRQEWCKALLRSPRLQEVFFNAPKLLRQRAEAALKMGRADEAIRVGTIAVSQSLLIFVAPLRAGNTVDLSLTGADATLHLERGDEAGLLLVPGDTTKNGKPIEAPFPDERGPYAPEGMMEWFRQTIRPMMLGRAGVNFSPWLFPGKSAGGNISYPSYLNWFKAEMAAIGLPMTPHQVRHGVATLMLDADPSALTDIASYLGDNVSTVIKYYIFIDRLKKHVEAQKRILSGLKGLNRRSERRA